MEKQLGKVTEQVHREMGVTNPVALQACLEELLQLLERWERYEEMFPPWAKGAATIPKQTWKLS